jgi:hypothetical protein
VKAALKRAALSSEECNASAALEYRKALWELFGERIRNFAGEPPTRKTGRNN